MADITASMRFVLGDRVMQIVAGPAELGPGKLDPGVLSRQITIERPVSDNSLDGAGSGEWEKVAAVWAEVQDVLPSRAERIANGINLASRPARVRLRYRGGDLEFMVEDYSTAGAGA